MKKVIVSTVAIAGLLMMSGCAPKKSCNSAKKVTKIKKKAPVVRVAPPVVVAPAPAPVIVEERAPAIIQAPVVDSKESCVK